MSVTTVAQGITLHESFPRYEDHHPQVPVWCVTPGVGRCLHRFFDTSPFSPSGRYLACFRLPTEERLPKPGERGEVVVVDLVEGVEHVVASTQGFESQMGCNLNWGSDDHTLIFNDVDTETWTSRLVKLDWVAGTSQRWPGGVYQVSPEGRYAASASLDKMRRTQPGYGVVLPDDAIGRNIGAVDDDGLFITDLQTGERRLVVSLAQAAAVIPELCDASEEQRSMWEIYGFHCKWAPTGDRLIFTVRRYLHDGQNRLDAFEWAGPRGVRYDVLTLRPDGSELCNAVPAARWEKGGHHINFFPDGTRLSMNLGDLRDGRGGLDLVQVDIDGQNLKKITDAADGSGHPTVHPDGRHILTDTYVQERWTQGDTTPLRWIDLEGQAEREIVRMTSQPPALPHPGMRLDPHPAWDSTWQWVAFNAIVDGTRRVMVADMRGLLVA